MKILISIFLMVISSLVLIDSIFGEEFLKQDISIQEKANEDKVDKARSPLTNYEFNFLSLMFKTIFALGLITGLIYFMFRFFMKSRAFPFSSSSFIHLIGIAQLAPNKYIQLVEVADKILVLGISGENINLLSEIREKETIDLIKTYASRELGKEKMPFTHYLKSFFKGISLEDYNKKIDFLKRQHQRLKHLEES